MNNYNQSTLPYSSTMQHWLRNLVLLLALNTGVIGCAPSESFNIEPLPTAAWNSSVRETLPPVHDLVIDAHKTRVDSQGNTYSVNGAYVTAADGTKQMGYFLSKISANGALAWNKPIALGAGLILSKVAVGKLTIDLDVDGNLYILLGGVFRAPLPEMLNRLEWYFIKVDPLGNMVWEQTFSAGAGINYPYGLRVGDNNQLYVYGMFLDGAAISQDGAVDGVVASTEIITASYDLNGQLLWNRSISIPYFSSLLYQYLTGVYLDMNASMFGSQFSLFYREPETGAPFLDYGSPPDNIPTAADVWVSYDANGVASNYRRDAVASLNLNAYDFSSLNLYLGVKYRSIVDSDSLGNVYIHKINNFLGLITSRQSEQEIQKRSNTGEVLWEYSLPAGHIAFRVNSLGEVYLLHKGLNGLSITKTDIQGNFVLEQSLNIGNPSAEGDRPDTKIVAFTLDSAGRIYIQSDNSCPSSFDCFWPQSDANVYAWKEIVILDAELTEQSRLISNMTSNTSSFWVSLLGTRRYATMQFDAVGNLYFGNGIEQGKYDLDVLFNSPN